jgi:hypothetical protein
VKKSLLLLLSLASCGYQWQTSERPTVSIPFIAGDDDGSLITEITHTLASSGLMRIVSQGGAYMLKVTIKDNANEIIGYRIDPQKVNQEVIEQLLATEGRKTTTLEFSLLQNNEIALGPYKVQASSEYDYVDQDSLPDLVFTTPDGSTQVSLPFSLGQLESMEAAQEAATRPLYTRLAQKIADVLSLNL